MKRQKEMSHGGNHADTLGRYSPAHGYTLVHLPRYDGECIPVGGVSVVLLPLRISTTYWSASDAQRHMCQAAVQSNTRELRLGEGKKRAMTG